VVAHLAGCGDQRDAFQVAAALPQLHRLLLRRLQGGRQPCVLLSPLLVGSYRCYPPCDKVRQTT